jgi:hypothetical protein
MDTRVGYPLQLRAHFGDADCCRLIRDFVDVFCAAPCLELSGLHPCALICTK